MVQEIAETQGTFLKVVPLKTTYPFQITGNYNSVTSLSSTGHFPNSVFSKDMTITLRPQK